MGICNLVCRTFNEIISEPELWRVICYNYDELFIWDKVSVGPRIQGSRIIIGNIMNIGNRNIKSARIQINSPLLCPSPYGGLRNFGMINGPTTNHTIRKSLIEEINDPCFEIKVKFEALKNVSTKKQKKEHEDDLIQYKTLSESKYFQSIESYLKPPLQIIPIALVMTTILFNLLFLKNYDFFILTAFGRFLIFFPLVICYALFLILLLIHNIKFCKFSIMKNVMWILLMWMTLLLYTLCLILRFFNLMKIHYLSIVMPYVVGLISLAVIGFFTLIFFIIKEFNWIYIKFGIPSLLFLVSLSIFIIEFCEIIDNHFRNVNNWFFVFIPLYISLINLFFSLLVLDNVLNRQFVNKYWNTKWKRFLNYLWLIGTFLIFTVLLALWLEKNHFFSFSFIMLPLYLFEFPLLIYSINVIKNYFK